MVANLPLVVNSVDKPEMTYSLATVQSMGIGECTLMRSRQAI